MVNFGLSQVARKLVNEDAFYLPHNLDFRGRAYPMHPNLNHLGSDMCRGVLEFAKGRPLGETGLRWLKIHLANLYGGSISKLSFDARVAHVDTHMDDVFDSAENPMNGNRWWLKAEDPFQFLAACIDIRNAVKSGNPKTYNSFLPVHQVRCFHERSQPIVFVTVIPPMGSCVHILTDIWLCRMVHVMDCNIMQPLGEIGYGNFSKLLFLI